jgi:DNA-binding response OmpR family regulator
MHILIVEDEVGIVQFLQQGLEEEGYQVTSAFDGLQGLELTQKCHFDLILLDWMLPKMTGLDLCKAIRKTNVDTPILFLTARDTVHEELIERIKIHFRNQKELTILTLGTIQIDIAKHSVSSNKTLVQLTNREFDLLCYLVKNKGKVCTRNQIIEDVWDIHFDYDTGVIDVFINAIRKKLNLKIEEDYIKTVRGVGYIAND